MKFILIVFLLLAAYGLVVILLRRLNTTSQQLAALHDDMARNNARMQDQMKSLQRDAAAREAQEAARTPSANSE